MRNIFSVLTISCLLTSPSLAQVVFTEDFDDGMAADRWSDPIVETELGSDAFDGSVDYAFDYSTVGVPPAPGGGGTTGIFFEANATDAGPDIDEGETVAVIAEGFTIPAGNFELTMDVYLNVNTGGGGTTEYATVGVFATGPTAPGDSAANGDAPFRFDISDGDGLAWQFDTDGDSGTDILRFVDPGNANAGSETGLGGYEDIEFGTIPGVVTGAGDPENPLAGIGPGNSWVTVGISSVNNMISFSMNGAVIDTYDNSGGELAGGTIMIGHADPFNSVNFEVDPAVPTNFGVIDNITMTIPEPSGNLLAAIALVGGLSLRLRRRN